MIEYIEFEYYKPNYVNMVIGIVATVIVIILIIGIIGGNILKLIEKNKEKKMNNSLAKVEMNNIEPVEENPIINSLLAPDTTTAQQQTIEMPLPKEEDEQIKTDFYE